MLWEQRIPEAAEIHGSHVPSAKCCHMESGTTGGTWKSSTAFWPLITKYLFCWLLFITYLLLTCLTVVFLFFVVVSVVHLGHDCCLFPHPVYPEALFTIHPVYPKAFFTVHPDTSHILLLFSLRLFSLLSSLPLSSSFYLVIITFHTLMNSKICRPPQSPNFGFIASLRNQTTTYLYLFPNWNPSPLHAVLAFDSPTAFEV